MTLLGFALIHFLTLGLLVVLAYALGRRALLQTPFATRIENLAVSTAVGLGLLSLIALVLGLLGWFNRPVVAGALALAFLLSYRAWFISPASLRWRIGRPWVGPTPKVWLWILGTGLLLLVTAPIWSLSLYPPTIWDTTSYHLAVAKIWVQQGAVVVTPYLRFPVFPQAGDVLFALSLLFADEIVAQGTQFLCLILCGLLLYAWGKREDSARAGLWAAALWACSPMVLLWGSTALIDVGLSLFVFAGAYGIARWTDTRRVGWLMAAAFLTGSAAATKYSGLVFVLLYAAWIPMAGTRGTRLRSVSLFLGMVLATAAPWYVRNLVVTGDPLFPFLPEIFGYSFWNAADVAAQKAELLSHGFGRTPLSLLTIWWHIGWNQGLLGGESLSSLALAIPVPILVLLRWRVRRARFLGWVMFPYLLIWFFQAQLLRYLLPILPFLCLEVAALIDGALGRIRRLEARRVRIALGGVVALLILGAGLRYTVDLTRERGPVPTSPVQRDAYLARRLATYPAYQLLNRERGRGYVLYAYRFEPMAYFADGVFMGDNFGPARFSLIESRLGDGQHLYDELRRLGADHFLVTPRAGAEVLPDDDAFHRHFRPIYRNDDVQLFQLVSQPD